MVTTSPTEGRGDLVVIPLSLAVSHGGGRGHGWEGDGDVRV